MNPRAAWNYRALTGAALCGLIIAGTLISASPEESRHAAKVRKGFAISPVAMDQTGKNPDLVGYGSYLVNAVGGCADCHASSLTAVFAPGGNPAFGQPKKFNATGYLGGGRDFGPFPGLEHLIARNLTPDKSGRAVGGMQFSDFVTVMRTGVDNRKLHPSCSASVTTNCLPPPFNGNVLQVMPWAAYQDMDDYDLLAIYQYLSSIPCVAGSTVKTDLLYHECK
jgi:hypothetical protein